MNLATRRKGDALSAMSEIIKPNIAKGDLQLVKGGGYHLLKMHLESCNTLIFGKF
jgi:hypothetical protein